MYLRSFISEESFGRKHAHVLKRYIGLITRVDPISYGTVLLRCVLKPRVERIAGRCSNLGENKRVSKVILLTLVPIVCRKINKMYRVVPVMNYCIV